MRLSDLISTLKDFNEFSTVSLDISEDNDDCFLVISHPTLDVETKVRLKWLDDAKCEHCDGWMNLHNPTCSSLHNPICGSENPVPRSKASSVCSKCNKSSADGEYCENGLCMICCIDSAKCRGYREPEKLVEVKTKFCTDCGDEITDIDFGSTITICRSCDIYF